MNSTLSELIYRVSVANTQQFYKEWVVRRTGSIDNYITIENYFNKYSKGKFQFETSWSYKTYHKWFGSDKYIQDINTIVSNFEDDIVDGFGILCAETINMEDDDTVEYTNWIRYEEEFGLLKTKTEKLCYIALLYQNNDYSPIFDYSWLYNLFHGIIISDI